MIFVFGSNLAGVHGAGAALYARKYEGAVPGIGIGHQDNSYALPTKDRSINTLSLHRIKYYVDQFIDYAKQRSDLRFKVTQIGCGLAGYTAEDIAPMFYDAPSNCYFDSAWFHILTSHKNYWN